MTSDNTIRTAAVAEDIRAGGAAVMAMPYSPTVSMNAEIIDEVDTTDPGKLSMIDFQPLADMSHVVTEVKLLEEAAIDIEVNGGTRECAAAAPCEVTFSYTDDDLRALGIAATALSIFHYTGGWWEELRGRVDSSAMTITVNTSSFSPFALGTVVTQTDTMPSFATGAMVQAQAYSTAIAIPSVTLPVATGGNGDLTYKLEGLPDGLNFDPTTRILSGTPSPTEP